MFISDWHMNFSKSTNTVHKTIHFLFCYAFSCVYIVFKYTISNSWNWWPWFIILKQFWSSFHALSLTEFLPFQSKVNLFQGYKMYFISLKFFLSRCLYPQSLVSRSEVPWYFVLLLFVPAKLDPFFPIEADSLNCSLQLCRRIGIPPLLLDLISFFLPCIHRVCDLFPHFCLLCICYDIRVFWFKKSQVSFGEISVG